VSFAIPPIKWSLPVVDMAHAVALPVTLSVVAVRLKTRCQR
jgi:hypothetical protein